MVTPHCVTGQAGSFFGYNKKGIPLVKVMENLLQS